MSAVETVLSRLDGVKRTGSERGIARCPAHDDRHPSLSWREGNDGRLLIHCWAGCGVDEIVHAVGLSLEDLFPPRDAAAWGAGSRPVRRPWSAADLLNIAAAEAQVVWIVASDIAQGRTPSDDDRERAAESARRLAEMVEACAA